MEKERTLGPILIIPIALLILGLIAYPFFASIWMSFTEKLIARPATFAGLKNYQRILGDYVFRRTVKNTFIYTFAAVPLKLVLGMGMALLLNEQFKGRGILRGLLLLPWIVPDIVSILTWRWMYDDMRGIINLMLMKIRLISQPVAWLSYPNLAMIAVVLVNAWRGFPFFGVMILAGLQAIPAELYEAAQVDGASWWQRFWYITVPSTRYVTLVATILSTIWTFGDFQIIYVLTRGGPANTTHLLATLSYDMAFSVLDLGRGVAIAIFAFPFLALLILMFARYLRREELQ